MDYTFARKIANESCAPRDEPLYNAIGNAATNLAACEQTLRRNLRHLRSRLDDVEEQLDRTDRQSSLNNLGALQGAGPEFDVTISRFCALQNELNTLLDLAKKLHPAS